MNIGPKMAFILHVYKMTESENAADEAHDREMREAGLITEREFMKRISTRSVARRLRHRDDAGNWPRDPNYEVGRSGVPPAIKVAEMAKSMHERETKH